MLMRAWPAGVALLAPGLLAAQREPVLRQIKVPHSYYYREMYLPQLTSGPSAVTWSPDGSELIYSMQGSLWRQKLGSKEARQLTSGPGYAYQPDWSPDGRFVAFARYDRDAVELQLLDLSTGATRPLVADGAVNVEPRWSPDGTRLAFVSSSFQGRWHIFVASLRGRRHSGHGRANHRRPAQPTAAILLRRLRPVSLTHLVSGREGADPHLEPGPHLGLGRILADAGAAGNGTARAAL